MWSPVGGRRFDLIVANLPHFPMVDSADPRPPADLERRRRRRPPAARSVPRGPAPAIWRRAAARSSRTMASSASNARARSSSGLGFALRVVLTTLVYISDDKLARMTQAVLRAAGRPVDPSLRPLRLRRSAHRRDRSARDDRRMRRLFRALVVACGLARHGAAARPAGQIPRRRAGAAAAGGARHAAGRLLATQCRPTRPHPLRRAHPGRRSRLLSAVRHPRRARRARATRSTWRCAIAQRLGVEVEFVRVNAATRIPLLAEDRIDLVIATMGHNTQRDGQVRFIRPHYYQSETTVVGPRSLGVSDWKDIRRPHRLRHRRQRLERRAGRPGRPAHAVRRGGRPARAAEGRDLHPGRTGRQLLRRILHRSGLRRGVTTRSSALPRCRGAWRSPATGSAQAGPRARPDQPDLPSRRRVPRVRAASTASARPSSSSSRPSGSARTATPTAGSANHACVLPPFDAELKPTPFAGSVAAFEAWFESRTGIDLTLPMLKTAPAWSMFKNGVVNSLILIAGALVATLGVALLFGCGAWARGSALLRWPARAAHRHAAILADRADAGHRRGDRPRALSLFRRRGARRLDRWRSASATAAMPARRSPRRC